MAKNRKRSYRMYSAWNYRKEIEDLDRASEQGWQLVRGGCFHSSFVRNPEVRYRYQLDFRRIEDMGRYIETFREQGWEYVNSTFNGWHYFRKLYDPSLPEETYEIFSDRESLGEMNGRWARVALAVGAAVGALALLHLVRMVREPCLPALVLLLTFALESAVLFRGAAIMRNPLASRSRRGDSAFLALFFAVVIIGAAAGIALTELRPAFSTAQQAGSIDEPVVDSRWARFDVRYPDNYYLDLKIDADAPLTFSIVDAAGNAVYTETGDSFDQENIRVRLDRGTYWFSMSCDAGFAIQCAIG